MPTAAHVFPPTPPERYDTGNEHVDNMLNTAADVYARSELAAPQRFNVMGKGGGAQPNISPPPCLNDFLPYMAGGTDVLTSVCP